jgi:hypothetical protein
MIAMADPKIRAKRAREAAAAGNGAGGDPSGCRSLHMGNRGQQRQNRAGVRAPCKPSGRVEVVVHRVRQSPETVTHRCPKSRTWSTWQPTPDPRTPSRPRKAIKIEHDEGGRE